MAEPVIPYRDKRTAGQVAVDRAPKGTIEPGLSWWQEMLASLGEKATDLINPLPADMGDPTDWAASLLEFGPAGKAIGGAASAAMGLIPGKKIRDMAAFNVKKAESTFQDPMVRMHVVNELKRNPAVTAQFGNINPRIVDEAAGIADGEGALGMYTHMNSDAVRQATSTPRHVGVKELQAALRNNDEFSNLIDSYLRQDPMDPDVGIPWLPQLDIAEGKLMARRPELTQNVIRHELLHGAEDMMDPAMLRSRDVDLRDYEFRPQEVLARAGANKRWNQGATKKYGIPKYNFYDQIIAQLNDLGAEGVVKFVDGQPATKQAQDLIDTLADINAGILPRTKAGMQIKMILNENGVPVFSRGEPSVARRRMFDIYGQ